MNYWDRMKGQKRRRAVQPDLKKFRGSVVVLALEDHPDVGPRLIKMLSPRVVRLYMASRMRCTEILDHIKVVCLRPWEKNDDGFIQAVDHDGLVALAIRCKCRGCVALLGDAESGLPGSLEDLYTTMWY